VSNATLEDLYHHAFDQSGPESLLTIKLRSGNASKELPPGIHYQACSFFTQLVASGNVQIPGNRSKHNTGTDSGSDSTTDRKHDLSRLILQQCCPKGRAELDCQMSKAPIHPILMPYLTSVSSFPSLSSSSSSPPASASPVSTPQNERGATNNRHSKSDHTLYFKDLHLNHAMIAGIARDLSESSHSPVVIAIKVDNFAVDLSAMRVSFYQHSINTSNSSSSSSTATTTTNQRSNDSMIGHNNGVFYASMSRSVTPRGFHREVTTNLRFNAQSLARCQSKETRAHVIASSKKETGETLSFYALAPACKLIL
jgi:hypothetical protein